jgi:hypothetical protein
MVRPSRNNFLLVSPLAAFLISTPAIAAEVSFAQLSLPS